MPRWGAHFSARAQERLLNLAIADNASVSGLESLFVQMTLAECRRQVAPVVPGLVNNSFQRNRAEIPSAYPDRCWEVLDSINLEEAFQWRCSVLQNCPCHVRGRFRQVARHALEARSHDSRQKV